jgi:hypothetical protein
MSTDDIATAEDTTSRPTNAATTTALDELADLFCRTVRQLGKAGQVEDANRLAGKAWWILHDVSPDAAEHVNGVMHFLARLPGSDPTERTPE